jgi:glutathione peroxidase
MYTILFSILSFLTFSDIYTLTVPAIGGGASIHFGDFRGKKILIVNTSSNSPFTPQYGRLEQLYQQYKDSLVIVAFPANDFNHEPGTEDSIENFVQRTYSIHYLLAGKTAVTGLGQSDLYKWLTSRDLNETMSSTVQFDFQKYLIGSDGHLIGYFTGAMDPMDATIQNAIRNNGN